MIRKIELHHRVIEALQEIVREESIPVKIMLGNETIDYNGDKQIEACLEFADTDTDIVYASLTKAINHVVDLFTKQNDLRYKKI